MALDDYGALIRSAQGILPDYGQEQQQQQLLDIKKQEAAIQLSQFQQAQKQRQQFQTDLGTVLTDPSAQNVSSLIMKHPEFADQLKGAWNLKDKAVQDADLTQMGEVYSAASSGNFPLAAKALRARIDADKASGHADPSDEAIATAFESGTPQEKKAALGMVGVHLAATTGAEHFGTVYGALKGGYTLDAGATRYDANGNEVARSPFLKTADGGIVERDGAGTAPAKGAAQTPVTPGGDGGFANAVAFSLKHEGGYNPSDMNGSPVNFGINQAANPGVDVKNLTQDQAAQIYKTKYWDKSGAAKLPAVMQTPYFDTYIINPARAQQFLKQSGGDPNKFMDLREAWMSKVAEKHPAYAKAYATRNTDLRSEIGSDTSQPYYSGAPQADTAPPGYHTLVPGKGKPAPQGWEWDPANPDQLRPIKNGPNDPSTEALTPDAVNFYAQEVLSGTPMSQLGLGMGKSAAQNRRQIMQQVAKSAGAEGLSGNDLAIQIAHYKAGTANVSNLEKQLGAVEGNELTFQQNAQQVLDRSRELQGQTGSRILNTPIQTYLRQTNDPTIAAMDVAIKTAANEYARLITSAPSGAGPLSDSARTEYQNIIQGNFPLAQKIAALRQMQVDARNRTASLHSNLQSAYSHLTDKAPELKGGGSQALPKGAKIVGTYQGKRVIEVNGKRMVEQ